jgi:hypothetical protein
MSCLDFAFCEIRCPSSPLISVFDHQSHPVPQRPQIPFGAISAILGELVDESLADYIDMDVAARSEVMLKLVQV